MIKFRINNKIFDIKIKSIIYIIYRYKIVKMDDGN